ncbi:peptidylprolyl isomerase [Helicobacter kayseriensis]|uniref:peptidylprolyl isomerase n=1 Tax=Helicobacter kayseriensis TaxID=2905877 RepID=UPI001E600A9C|nr:peptidylprolyl isomerase [Helicobacter kayseriensis]MCE3046780.1 peptidylprolyl isomerase [Helicobacter kayseriensis]MCE3047918.1 peptidylprolyl isomerase [Helicobacter kayseriensis]
MRKFLVSSVVAGMLCVTLANAEVYATVDGQKVTEKDMEFFKQVIPGFDFDKLSKQDKEMAINQLIERKLALLAAKKDKIDNTKEYKEALNMIRNNLAIDLWVKQQQQKFASEVKIGKEDAKKFYDSNKNLFIEQQAQARMIVVKTEKEAQDIINDLKKKKGDALLKAFIEMANKKSIDPGVQKSQNGGDLGTVNRNQMLPQFTEAVFGLKPGSITTEPIQTEAGYHIIYLQDKTEPKTISFDQAQTVIENNLKNQKVGEMLQQEMAEMRKKAKVKVEPIK